MDERDDNRRTIAACEQCGSLYAALELSGRQDSPDRTQRRVSVWRNGFHRCRRFARISCSRRATNKDRNGTNRQETAVTNGAFETVAADFSDAHLPKQPLLRRSSRAPSEVVDGVLELLRARSKAAAGIA